MELQFFNYFLKSMLKLSYFIILVKKKKRYNKPKPKKEPKQKKKEAYNEKNQERDTWKNLGLAMSKWTQCWNLLVFPQMWQWLAEKFLTWSREYGVSTMRLCEHAARRIFNAFNWSSISQAMVSKKVILARAAEASRKTSPDEASWHSSRNAENKQNRHHSFIAVFKGSI